MRELLVRWLTPAGYQTKEAPDAETALELLTATPFDVVLSDVQMPGHDGLWLVKRIRERFPRVAVLLATAVQTVPPAVSMQDGVIAYLVKPLDRKKVLAAVSEAMNWQQAAAVGKHPTRPTAVDPVMDWLNGGRSRKSST
jgi:two-component system response regulator FlrC